MMSAARLRGLIYAVTVACALIVIGSRWRHNALREQFIAAVIRGDEPAVAQMLANGADPNTVKTGRVEANTPEYKVSVLRIALANGSNNAPNKRPYFSIIRQLVDAGADVKEAGVFSSVLHTHHRETVQLFLDKGMKPEANGLSAAIEYGDTDIVRQVLAFSPELNRVKHYEQLPLSKAAAVGYATPRCENSVLIGKMLIDHGAALNPLPREKSSSGQSRDDIPLCDAAQLGNVPFMELLHRHGAKINIRKEDGSTPLHFAAMRDDCREAVKWLLAHGADVHARNRDGRTPLDIALLNRRSGIVALLKNAGATEGKRQ
jgi:ankyrin repeat protein